MKRNSDSPITMSIVNKYSEMGTVVTRKVESGQCKKGQNLSIYLHKWDKFWLFLHWHNSTFPIKFVFSKKATKIDEIFTVNLTLTTYCQINGEDYVNFSGLLRIPKI